MELLKAEYRLSTSVTWKKSSQGLSFAVRFSLRRAFRRSYRSARLSLLVIYKNIPLEKIKKSLVRHTRFFARFAWYAA
jgi:hypothetical protein